MADFLPATCECADPDCAAEVLVTAREYADAHGRADWVLVLPGHACRPGGATPRLVRGADRFEVWAEGWDFAV